MDAPASLLPPLSLTLFLSVWLPVLTVPAAGASLDGPAGQGGGAGRTRGGPALPFPRPRLLRGVVDRAGHVRIRRGGWGEL